MPWLLAETEIRRLAEQERLDRLKDADERNRWGQFATPPLLSLDIARYAYDLWSQGPAHSVRFLDPSIGTGSFYSALRQVFPDRLIERAAGIELDPGFAAAAISLWNKTNLEVMQADFTNLSPQRRFNLILTNPPYVRHHHLSGEAKRRCKNEIARELGLAISGLAGLYCHFLLLADQWLEPDGLGIWLIPSEFLDVNYGSAVKEYLKSRVTLLHVHRFCPSDMQFSDALVSSAVVVVRKAVPQPNHEVRFSFGGPVTDPRDSGVVSVEELCVTDKWTRYPARIDAAEESTKGRASIGDLFTIKRGLATGDNDFFIIPEAKANNLEIPETFRRPILPSPRYLPQSIVGARPDGYPDLDEPLCLIDCNWPEERLAEHYPAFWNYLAAGKLRGVHEGYLASRRTPWYSQERREPAPFLCTYMGRKSDKKAGNPFRFLWNKSQATAANVYLLLYPRPAMRQNLARNSQLYQTVFELLSQITGPMFLDESRVYGGGLYKVEPKELARVSATPLLAALDDVVSPRQAKLFA